MYTQVTLGEGTFFTRSSMWSSSTITIQQTIQTAWCLNLIWQTLPKGASHFQFYFINHFCHVRLFFRISLTQRNPRWVGHRMRFWGQFLQTTFLERLYVSEYHWLTESLLWGSRGMMGVNYLNTVLDGKLECVNIWIRSDKLSVSIKKWEGQWRYG